MNFRFPTLSLLTIALLLFPSLLQTGIAQTAPTPNASQPNQPRSDRTTQAEADRLREQGFQQLQNSQFQDALQSLRQALNLYQEISDRAGEREALNLSGATYYSLGEYEQALETFQQELLILRELNDRAGEGFALKNIGAIYESLEQYPQALEFYEQALSIWQEVSDRNWGSSILINIGEIYQSLGYINRILGRYPQALEQYQQALAISREVDDRTTEGTTLHDIGVVYRRLGRYSEALEQYQQALAISREVDDRAAEGTTLTGMGGLYGDLGQYPQALEQLQQALAISREVDDRAGEGVTLNNIGAIYQGLGQYPQALEYYQQALAISREVDDRAGEGRALNNIAVTYAELGQYPQALEQLQQALAIDREMNDRASEGTTLISMGMVHWSLGHYPQALEQLQQALVIIEEVDDRAAEGAIFTNMGTVYWSLGQYPQALEQLQQALVISREVGSPAVEGTTLTNMGAVQFWSGQFTAATETLFDAIEVQESLRASELSDISKIALIETQVDSYAFLQQALIAQNKTETALEVAERGRARAFVELLAQQASSAPSQSIAVSAPTITQVKQIAREQNATLVEYSIVTVPVRIEGRTEWQPLKLYIWVVKPTGEVTFRSVDLSASDASLDTMIALGRQAIGARGRGSDLPLPPQIGQQPEQVQDQLQQLYQVLIEPIADLLPSNPNDHVIFIPQGELFSVPFPALQDANGKYLIENHTISTAPSIQVLDLTQQLRREAAIEPSQVLIVGNPTMPALPAVPPQPPLPRLPGAEQEAIAIARQFYTQPLLGSAATETAVVQRMQTARLIHLATHGLLEYGDPQASGVRDMPGAIALAPSAQADGLLTSSEISNLNLSADLVVLSACNTARGDITGDGVIGLSRALISAGVPSVIVSLWTVPDDATEVLMSEFYRQLRQQPDKAQALRQAMLQTMQEYPDPIDWAAFTLIGEAE